MSIKYCVKRSQESGPSCGESQGVAHTVNIALSHVRNNYQGVQTDNMRRITFYFECVCLFAWLIKCFKVPSVINDISYIFTSVINEVDANLLNRIEPQGTDREMTLLIS